MNTDFENIPSVIFDWIETHDFLQLNSEQQQNVVTHFSREEYDAMRKTQLELRAMGSLAEQQVNSGRKEFLLEKFDAQHGRRKIIPLFSKSLIAWQAASVALFMLCGWLTYNLAGLKKDGGKQQTATLDTVFVTKEIRSEPAIIHDTIYLYRQAAAQQEHAAQPEEATAAGAHEHPGITEEMYVLPLNETHQQKPRGNSMKDDSLLKRYTFVSM